jgi:ankyrin repeat protein
MAHHRTETVLALIERGADVTLASGGVTPLRVGAWNGMTPEVLRALLAAGAVSRAREARHPASALQAAGRNGRTSIVDALLDQGVPVDAGLPGFTALMHAAAYGHVGTARFLIEHGADVNAVSTNGRTPLELAKENKRTEMIALLHDAGAGD